MTAKPRKAAPLTEAQKALRQARKAAQASFGPIATIEARLRLLGVPEGKREHRFHPERMWRFDLAWPEHRLAVEYDGGTYSRRPGGHTSVSGMARDREKDAHAAILGWSVIRLDARTYRRQGPEWVAQWFRARGLL